MEARFSYLSHLECSMCHRQYDSNQLHKTSPCCSRPLLAQYDLASIARDVTQDEIARREASMWRYHELLPVREKGNILTLGEGMTPLLAASRLAPFKMEKEVRLFIKDEGQNPTGSFKARGMAVAVSRAAELGVKGLAIPTAGNAGAALAAYAARGGLPAYVVAPKDAPESCIEQTCLYGVEVALIPGLISDAGRLAADVARQRGWFNVATLQEPYRVEGKKTMGLELAELHELGWLQDGKDRHLPKMIIVQAEGCAPLVRAFERGDEEAEIWPSEEANTLAAGLRVPAAIGDRLILKAIYESGGTAIRVSDEAMMQMVQYAAQREGMLIAFEAAATLAAYHTLLARHFLEQGDETVLFFTGSGLPYLPEIGKYSF